MNKKINIFSETALTILVSVVTLLLQLISFATTWSGSQIYLEGVFPYASLFFAVAIQATAYFFSNSLRTRVSVLKVAAMLVALCCSTYYSYIGIYNSVNSPERYLQERYVQIEEELTETYETGLEEKIGYAEDAVGNAASEITAVYTELSEERKNMEACRAALAEEGQSYAKNMRAPKESDYENYEDYVAAYNAYIVGMSAGNNTEEDASRKGILASYGFTTMEELQHKEAENAAEISSLKAALGMTELQEDEEILKNISDMSVMIVSALDETAYGREVSAGINSELNRLFHAARICGYEEATTAEIMNIAKRAAEITKEPLLADYTELVKSLEGGRVTSANTMDLKSAMDSEILSARIKMNSLLPEEERISDSDEQCLITDLYLIPIDAFRGSATRMTAFFCLGVAALIDLLSVLFAVSLRRRKPLWKRRTLLFGNLEDYIPQIYASLPKVAHPMGALTEFLEHFTPSPETECDGYMMCTDMAEMRGYYSLIALLCQINLAKVVPGGLLTDRHEEGKEILLLKARFVFWANSVIYENERLSV